MAQSKPKYDEDMVELQQSTSSPRVNETDVELQGLLSGERTHQSSSFQHPLLEDDTRREWLAKFSRRLTVVTAGLIFFACTALFLPKTLLRPDVPGPSVHPNAQFGGQVLRSNGTHDFKRTVLIVSIDGLR